MPALGCSDTALRRDECGDPVIAGKHGHIYAVCGAIDGPKWPGFMIYATRAKQGRPNGPPEEVGGKCWKQRQDNSGIVKEALTGERLDCSRRNGVAPTFCIVADVRRILRLLRNERT